MLPQLARPKGCFASYYAKSIDELPVYAKSIDELSVLGRTTRRLGYVRPNSAYAMGGTAELAQQYSN